MEMSLASICSGNRAIVTDIQGDRVLCARLRDFGMVPGTAVGCRCRSPWGDTLALEIRGSVVAVRADDVRSIRVRMGA